MEDKIALFRFLYNNCVCGDYICGDEFFSDLFIKTYREQYGTEHCGTEKYLTERNNPNIMKIYDLLGQEKSSKLDENGYLLSSLRITYFPVELQKYMNIQIFEGREYINIDRGKIHREFFERVVINNEPFEEIKNYYQRLYYVSDEYTKGMHLFNDENIFTKQVE